MRHLLLPLALTLLASSAAPAQTPGGEERTRATMQTLCTELSMPCNSCGQHRAGTASAQPPPTPRSADDPLRHPTDGWGRAVQISVGGEGVVLRSAGADGELGTADDLTRACGKAESASPSP
jgi:hypothetical protein